MKTVIEKVKKFRRRLKSNKGFTLVELLVSIVILSLVVFPTMEVFVTATKTNSKARTDLQATITAESVLESAKAFSIYVFDKQCNTTYSDSTASTFTLIAGKVSGSTNTSLVSSTYGGKVGRITYNSQNKITSWAPTSATFTARAEKYAYAINGIKQSNNSYDAIVVFEKQENNDVTVGSSSGTYSASSAQSMADKEGANYNYEYSITVYVYKHSDTPLYSGIDPENDTTNCLTKITGSKLDSASAPK